MTISLAAEPLFYIGTFPVTNTLTNTLLVDGVLLCSAYYIGKNVSLIPSKLQNGMEMTMNLFYDLTESVTIKQAPRIFPYMMSFFLFILVANWTGLLPIINRFGFYHDGTFVPFFRSASTDLNVTLALALVSLVATHVMSLQTLGIKQYLSRYFSLNPLNLYVGILELVSEFTKIISFSFRLFGNIFVGEVILGSLVSVFAFFLPIPLILYEMVVGIIQALVFGMLTMAFMAILTTPHEGGEH